MKDKMLLSAVLALVSISLVQPAPAATIARTQQGQAKVVSISGGATFRNANGESGNLKVGQILAEGASISSSPVATVELDLGLNGESLTIRPDSTVTIDQLDFSGSGADTVINTRLNLSKGGLNGNVKKLAANSRYEIKTVTGVAGVRGTTYSILASGIAHVWQGSLSIVYFVNGVASQPFLVLAGQTVYPPTTPGGVPTLGPLPADMERADTAFDKRPDREKLPNTTTFDLIVKRKHNSPK